MKPRERPSTDRLGSLLTIVSLAGALAIAVAIAVTERPRAETGEVAARDLAPKQPSKSAPPHDLRAQTLRARPIPIATTRSSR